MKNMFIMAFGYPEGKIDISRVMMVVMAFAYIGQSIYAMMRGQIFDWQSFGVGAGALVAGSGAGVWMHGRGQS